MSVVAQINDLKEQRASLWEANKELLLKAESEERDLTAEEAQEYDKREADMDSLGKRADRLEKMNGLEPKPTRQIQPGNDDSDEEKLPTSYREFQEQRAGGIATSAPEYRQAFYKWFTGDPSITGDELRVLSKASAGAGLNLVPTEFSNQLIDSLRDFGVMRQISKVISTDSGAALQIPSIASHGTAAWTAENASFTVSDEAFGQATLNAYKAATIMLVSEELLQDSAFDLEGYIRTEFGSRIGVLENTAYVVGDGSAKPTGVTTQASAGTTAATATTITFDNLVDLYHSLLPPYRRNAVWLMNDAVIKYVRKIKTGISGDTTYVWQPSVTVGQPDAILGKPVYADPDMGSAITTGLITALLGDFSYYWIRDVNGIAFQKLVELYAANGQVGFRAYHRTDGKLMNTAAVKKLTQA